MESLVLALAVGQGACARPAPRRSRRVVAAAAPAVAAEGLAATRSPPRLHSGPVLLADLPSAADLEEPTVIKQSSRRIVRPGKASFAPDLSIVAPASLSPLVGRPRPRRAAAAAAAAPPVLLVAAAPPPAAARRPPAVRKAKAGLLTRPSPPSLLLPDLSTPSAAALEAEAEAADDDASEPPLDESEVDDDWTLPPAAAPPPLPPQLHAAAGARDWQQFVDWQLMGFEHESLAEAEWAALRGRLRGLQDLWRPMVSYLHSLGLRDAELARLVSKEPQIFVGNVGRARSRVAYLQSSFGLTAAELVRVLVAAPRVMFLRIERTLAPRLAFLASLGVPPERLGHVLVRAPNLLYTQVATMEPRVEYLCFVLGLERRDIGRLVVRHPKLLTNNEAMLDSRLLYLGTLGLEDDEVRKMVMAHPQLLNYTPESMAPRVDWLRREVGMTAPEVARTVSRLSQLFSLSVENSLRPKYDYLTRELGGGKQALLDCPTYLSLSLAARIVPRHRFLAARGRAESPFNLSHFIHADARFLAHAKASAPEYEDFKLGLGLGLGLGGEVALAR